MQAKTALGQRRQAEHPHVWGGGRPSQPSLACSAAHLGQVVEEGPQPEEHGQHEHAGEEARQLQGEGHGAKAGRNLTAARERRPPASASAFLKVSLLPKPPSTLLFLSLRPLLFPLAQLTPVIRWLPPRYGSTSLFLLPISILLFFFFLVL